MVRKDKSTWWYVKYPHDGVFHVDRIFALFPEKRRAIEDTTIYDEKWLTDRGYEIKSVEITIH